MIMSSELYKKAGTYISKAAGTYYTTSKGMKIASGEIIMNLSFDEDLPYLRHEYENAEWDTCSGKSVETMEKEMAAFFDSSCSYPYPIAMAKAFEYVLENGMLDINTHTPFPDKICNGVVYHPHARASILEKYSTIHYREYLDKRIPAVRRMRELAAITGVAIPDLDVWHSVFDWSQIVSLGISGILTRLTDEKNKKSAAGELSEKQAMFYESAGIAVNAVIKYLIRLSDAAGAKGMAQVADVYRALTKRPPETLYEVLCLQHVSLTAGELARERIRSLGPVDKLWTPFYEADIKSGRMTREEIGEMFRYFLVKIAAEERYANQPICITTEWDEDSVSCDMAMLLLDEYQKLKIQNPKIHIRCSRNMPEIILRKLMDMTRTGSSSIILYNDDATISAYEKAGISRELAKDYLPLGCNETCIPGVEETHICSAWINLAKAVEYAITGGEDNLRLIYLFGRSDEPKTWEEFLTVYYAYLHRFAEFTLDNINKQAVHSYLSNPSPFISATMKSCVERGRDVFDCGLPLADESVKIFALGTAVDSLLAVKKYVYDEKAVTIPEFTKILRNNWRGAEALRARIQNDTVKWGNGEPEADSLASEIYAFMGREIIGKPTANGGVFRMGGDSVNMAEAYGKNTGATPDGRLACKPLSKNIRPVNGCEFNGISGLLKSFAAVDFTDTANGAPLDFMLHPSAVEGEKGLDFMCSIIRLFFKNGGCSIQGNVVDIDTLLSAKKEPEKYPDLQVRVCGWNEYFVNMTPVVQADMIKRASGGKLEG